MNELLRLCLSYQGDFIVRRRKNVLCKDARYLPGEVGNAFCYLAVSCVSASGGPDRWNMN
jgi:hypothetical protein